MNRENENCHRLYWLCNESGRRYPAGVAFFNESQGDFRLKVDLFPEDKVIYVKPVSVSLSENVVKFRVEAAIRKNGVVTHRAEIGVGHGSVDPGKQIYMDLGPYCRTLVLENA